VRPYKGLELLFDAFDQLVGEDPRIRLLIAGKPGRFPDLERWTMRSEQHPRIISKFAFIPDGELQVWLRAADLAVLPHQAVLNSSAFSLAIAYGLPVVAPLDGTLVELADLDYMRMFKPGSIDDLARALRSAVAELRTPAAAAAAYAAATRYPPEAMAADFAGLAATLFERRADSGVPPVVNYQRPAI
jgi:glycosyltransferase involved in cell wall biosynthesis